mgnify:CR=1 FL=1
MIVNRLGSTLFHVAKREIATSLPTRVRSFHSAKQKNSSTMCETRSSNKNTGIDSLLQVKIWFQNRRAKAKRMQEAEIEKLRMSAVRQHHTTLYGSHPGLLAPASLYPVGMLSHPGLTPHHPISQHPSREWEWKQRGQPETRDDR